MSIEFGIFDHLDLRAGHPEKCCAQRAKKDFTVQSCD